MQAVDVLGEHAHGTAVPVERGQGAVGRVGLGVPGGVVRVRAPEPLPHFRIGQEVLACEGFGRGRVARPHAVRAAVVRDPGVGRDPRAGQRGDAPQAMDLLQELFVHERRG